MSVAAPPDRRKLPTGRVVLYAVTTRLAIFYLIPDFILLMTALKTFGQVQVTSPWQPPTQPTLRNFADAAGALARPFFNSVELAIPATILSSLLGSLNGYVLAKWRFKGSNVRFTLVLFGMFIPYQSVLIPLVQT